MRAAPAEDDVRTQGGVLGIGRWPHAKVAPCPSAENFIDYADLAHVASAGVIVDYLVDEDHASSGLGHQHILDAHAQLVRVSTAAPMQPTMQPTQAKRAGTSRHANVS